MIQYSLSSRIGSRLSSGLVWLYLILTLLPFFFMVVTSIKPPRVGLGPFSAFKPTFKNYVEVWTGGKSSTCVDCASSVAFSGLLRNSTTITLATVILTILVAVPAAYGLTRNKFKSRKRISNWVLSTYMFPPIVSIIPVYVIVAKLNMIDNPLALIIPYAAFNMPISVWILRSSIFQIPAEIMEAAQVDGAKTWTELRLIVVPLIMPAIATTGILAAILTWNEFLFALALTRSEYQTAPVGIQTFTGMFGTQWGSLTAAGMLIVTPMLFMTLILRRKIVAGLTFGAVK